MIRPRGVIPQFTQGDRLRKARQHAGLHMAALAAELGVSEASVSRYESGKQNPRRAQVLTWALATGVDCDWLLDGTDHALRGAESPVPAPAPAAPAGGPVPDGSHPVRKPAVYAGRIIWHCPTDGTKLQDRWCPTCERTVSDAELAEGGG